MRLRPEKSACGRDGVSAGGDGATGGGATTCVSACRAQPASTSKTTPVNQASAQRIMKCLTSLTAYMVMPPAIAICRSAPVRRCPELRKKLLW